MLFNVLIVANAKIRYVDRDKVIYFLYLVVFNELENSMFSWYCPEGMCASFIWGRNENIMCVLAGDIVSEGCIKLIGRFV